MYASFETIFHYRTFSIEKWPFWNLVYWKVAILGPFLLKSAHFGIFLLKIAYFGTFSIEIFPFCGLFYWKISILTMFANVEISKAIQIGEIKKHWSASVLCINHGKFRWVVLFWSVHVLLRINIVYVLHVSITWTLSL